MLLGTLNRWMILLRNSTAFFEVALTKGMYSIHLENLSTSTNTNLKLSGAGLNGRSYLGPSSRMTMMMVSSRFREPVCESSWQRIDNPHIVGPTSRRRPQQMANKILLGKPFRLAFERLRDCHRIQRVCLLVAWCHHLG